MKKIFSRFVNQLIDLSFLSLLVVDFFIGFYYFSLEFLNRNFPLTVKVNFLIKEQVPYIKPEYDISLYLISLILLIFFLWGYTKLSRMVFFHNLNQKKIITVAKFILILPLGLYFIDKLGVYPMSETQTTNSRYFIPYLSGSTLLIIFFTILFFLIKTKKILKLTYLLLIVLMIGFLTFIAKFPIFYQDYSFFSGPILEIAHGKTIFNQIGSQYGFSFVLLLGYLAKFSLFDIAYLPMLVWFLYILQYFLCFYLILKISDSIILALMSLFSLLTINFFSLMVFGTVLPQTGPVRWLSLVLSLYLLYHFKDLRSKKFILSLVLLGSLIVDSGIYLVIAYSLTLVIVWLKQKITLVQICKSFAWLFIYSAGVYLIINLVNLSLGYQFINLLPALTKIKQYSQLGLLMMPIPNKSYIWLVVAMFILSLIYYLKQSRPSLDDNLLLYSSTLSALSLIYYLGRSHPHNLFNISLFFILNVSIFISVCIKKKSASWLKPAVLVIFYLFFILIPAYARKQAISDNINQQIDRLSQKDIFVPDMKLVLSKYNQEVELINHYIPEKNALIIFIEDTYLFYLTKKGNLMDINPQMMISSQEESDFALNNVYKICPKRIAVDCKLFNRCGTPQTLEEKVFAQRLSLIETKCQLKYSPLICTYQLCIGEAN